MKRIKAHLARFWSREDGVVTLEVVIVLPVLLWLFMALFVYWDAFRIRNNGVKASYTIADMISRETQSINASYIEGMHRVFQYMVDSTSNTAVRVTSIRYDEPSDSFTVLGSRTTNRVSAPALTTTTIRQLRPHIATPTDMDTLIVVETWRDFQPAFWIGLGGRVFHEVVVVRPRFISPLPIS